MVIRLKKTIEIDFVASMPGENIEYYQVCWLIDNDDEKTLCRELAPLEEINDNFPKFILSMDSGSETIRGIKRLNILEWLLKG